MSPAVVVCGQVGVVAREKGAYVRCFLHRMFDRLRPRPRLVSVRVSENGVVLLEDDRPRDEFAWADVRAVATFKRDLVVYDDVRLTFRVGDRWIEISEDAAGWPALMAEICRQFPSIPPDWYMTVMFPAFETCYRVLYECE